MVFALQITVQNYFLSSAECLLIIMMRTKPIYNYISGQAKLRTEVLHDVRHVQLNNYTTPALPHVENKTHKHYTYSMMINLESSTENCPELTINN